MAVRRHFRALGMDAQSEPLRVVGVVTCPAMSSATACSRARSICLVAAFDHRDVFIDPTPDAERSFAERERLSRLERSSWQDYDLGVASPGAGAYPRQAKQVELSSEAARVLGTGPGPISPPSSCGRYCRLPPTCFSSAAWALLSRPSTKATSRWTTAPTTTSGWTPARYGPASSPRAPTWPLLSAPGPGTRAGEAG